MDTFIKKTILYEENAIFRGYLILTITGYTGITFWLNATRATSSTWFVWVLIVIQLFLYFYIFSSSYTRASVIGLNKNVGLVLFSVLAVLGRVNDWEIALIPLLLIVMLVFSAKNKNVSDGRQYLLNDNQIN